MGILRTSENDCNNSKPNSIGKNIVCKSSIILLESSPGLKVAWHCEVLPDIWLMRIKSQCLVSHIEIHISQTREVEEGKGCMALVVTRVWNRHRQLLKS